MAIKYHTNKEIDTTLWNKCIDNAVNGNIFGYSWYLDMIADDWDALVDGNYLSVMPLPYKTILGNKIIYQPTFTSQLGIYSSNIIDLGLTERFYNEIPDSFKYVDLCFNKFNKCNENGLISYNHTKGYQLDIILNYSLLRDGYQPWLNKVLKLLEKNGINIVSGLQQVDLINMYRKNGKHSFFKMSLNELKSLRSIIGYVIRNASGELIGAYDKHNNLNAIGFFIYSHNNVHFLYFSQTKEGLKHGYIYGIVDYFIKKHSEKNITLSFIPITNHHSKFFDFKVFGAQISDYPGIYINKLPWYLQFLKLKI